MATCPTSGCSSPWNHCIEAHNYHYRLVKVHEYLGYILKEIEVTMDTEKVLGINPEDIPPADERDEWEEQEPMEEPVDLYQDGDPGPTGGGELLIDDRGVIYEQSSLIGDDA